MSSVAAEEMSSVATEEMSSVATEDMCCVAKHNTYIAKIMKITCFDDFGLRFEIQRSYASSF